MPTVKDVIRHIEKLSGHPLNADEGVQHGSPNSEVSLALVCWMADKAALEAAGRAGAGLVIGHESLYYPYDAVNRNDNPPGWREWPINRQRRQLLDRYGLTFLRIHGSADELCIFDDFAALLGLGQPLFADKLVKVYEIEPCTLGTLVERVRNATGMEHMRVAAPAGLDQIVRRVGLPWGGLGLFVNVAYQERLIELGCEVMIAGESDNYGFRFAAESGIPMIETSHEVSENPGLRHFAEILSKAMPDLRVQFYENDRVWQWM